MLFGFLSACTRAIEFSTQVMILPQRQTALVAKQAASLDVLSGGRFRFGIGVGWNPVEYVGLNEDFRNRGRRQEEQVEVMQKLWAEPHVTFKGQWHTIEDAGINPLPPRRRIPLWFGGHEDVTLRRIAKWGDGWIMLAHPLVPWRTPSSPSSGATSGRPGATRARRPGGVGVDRRGRPRRLAPAVAGLEGCGRHPRHRQQHLQSRPAQAHRRQDRGRPHGGDAGNTARRWRICCELSCWSGGTWGAMQTRIREAGIRPQR